jgi:hypothetical protein
MIPPDEDHINLDTSELPEDVLTLLETTAERRGYLDEAEAYREKRFVRAPMDAYRLMEAEAARRGISWGEVFAELARKKVPI